MSKFLITLFNIIAVCAVFFLIFGMLFFVSGDGMTSLVLTTVCAVVVLLAAINDWSY